MRAGVHAGLRSLLNEISPVPTVKRRNYVGAIQASPLGTRLT